MLRQDDAGKASFALIYQLPPRLIYLYMFSFKSILIIVTLCPAQVTADE